MTYTTREAASKAVSACAVQALAADIAQQGRASLFVSGGSTPRQTFEILSGEPLDWSKVTAGLVDERWVPPDHADSNERLVRSHFLKSFAGAAGLLPMWTPGVDAGLAAAERDLAYRPHCVSPSFVLLGMGTDGHTASWFPRMPGLDKALTCDNGQCVMMAQAAGAPVPHRLTLTGAAVVRARRAVLLIFGREKLDVLETAMASDAHAFPVRFAIDGLGDRLLIMWAD